jgi:hypothetical protein
MSLNKKLNILLILTSIGLGIFLVITILGAIFPSDPSPNQAPWFVLAAIGEVITFIIVGFITCFIIRKKDKELKEQNE